MSTPRVTSVPSSRFSVRVVKPTALVVFEKIDGVKVLPRAGLARTGGVEAKEMLRTFNCGVGMIAIVRRDAVEAVTEAFTAGGETVTLLGEVIEAVRKTGKSGALTLRLTVKPFSKGKTDEEVQPLAIEDAISTKLPQLERGVTLWWSEQPPRRRIGRKWQLNSVRAAIP